MNTLASSSSKFIFFFLFSFIVFLCSSGSFIYDVKDIRHKATKRKLIRTTQHDFTNSPFTNYPTTPITNPVTTPSTGAATTPPTITVPPTVDPTTPTVTNPAMAPPIMTDPPPVDPTTPAITNPGVAPPIMTVPPAIDPTTPTGTSPVVGPPAVPGQSWCVARGGLPEIVIQVALDYACGIGGADCSAIQQGQSCYNPNSLENHASYAFNSYFQKNPVQTSCDFGGAAMITNINPSSGSCIFPTWSSSSASPATMSPTTTTPMPTPATYGATPVGSSSSPPIVMNASNPALGGGFGEITPSTDTTSPASASASMSSSSKPFTSFITLMVSIIIGNSWV